MAGNLALRALAAFVVFLLLPLPAHLLDDIKAAANVRDMPYQSLIKAWLYEKVQGRTAS